MGRIRTPILALALGIVTTVAVSWSIAAATLYGSGSVVRHAERQRSPARGEGTGEILVNRHEAAGMLLLETVTRPNMGIVAHEDPEFASLMPAWARWNLVPWGRGVPWPEEEWDRRAVRGTGWPLIALWHEYRWLPDRPGGPRHAYEGEYLTPGGMRIEPSDGTPGAWRVSYPRALSLRPNIAGFAANSLLFALLWSVPLVAPRLVRSRIRGRRGRCIACGYNRAGTPEGSPCPECGGGSSRAS